MRDIKGQISHHYTHGRLVNVLNAALDELGDITPAELIERLGAIDEFHVGGRAATLMLAGNLPLRPGQNVLDIGCGLGGTARMLATRLGAHVTGIDLTAEYVEAGNSLNARAGLAGQIKLLCADAAALPFEPGSFDTATLLHAGMNIPDKAGLFAEAARVLKPGGYFALYDVMRTGEGALAYPLPWASDESISFVEKPEAYRRGLEAAGFEILLEASQLELALAFFAKLRARGAEGPPPPLGLHVLMGAEAPRKLANISANIEAGLIAPVLMLARRC